MRKKYLKKTKGIFKRCKACKGYGYIDQVREIDWVYDEHKYSFYTNPPEKKDDNKIYRKIRSLCEVCYGTGEVTWVQHIMGK